MPAMSTLASPCATPIRRSKTCEVSRAPGSPGAVRAAVLLITGNGDDRHTLTRNHARSPRRDARAESAGAANDASVSRRIASGRAGPGTAHGPSTSLCTKNRGRALTDIIVDAAGTDEEPLCRADALSTP